MSDRDPRTVLTTNHAEAAEKVVELLASKGIVAEVYTPPLRAISEPLMGTTELSIPEEHEVRVTDPTKAEEVRTLLEGLQEVAAFQSRRQKREQQTGTLTAACEDCGKSSDWPAAVMGTTEVCPHCGGYMDIPDPDEDWGDMDFGEGEEEGEEKE